jgi:Ser/Thr protein kinase RdoA (MazF antagonist)
MDNAILLQLSNQFNIEGHPCHVEEFGSGHINDTYKVLTDSAEGADYLLQRINHHVFKDVDVLMRNIDIVTGHLRTKISGRPVLTIVRTRDDKLYYKDQQGSYWRMMILIGGTKSYDIVETESQAREGGRAFGEFQAQLSDLDTSTIDYTIPNFCNIDYRMKNFHRAVADDVVLRKEEVADEIDFIVSRQEKRYEILQMGERGELPLRITHNDTKFNNVLLDQDDKARCVIDLDTVMPGYAAYDFGDAIRTIINSAAEDEADLSKIQLNIPLFKAFTEGYFEYAHAFLTPGEVRSLKEGVLLFPYMQAVRFLTDYLEGDNYYKIQHPAHNLQRARAQLKLALEVENHHELIGNIIRQTAEQYLVQKDG